MTIFFPTYNLIGLLRRVVEPVALLFAKPVGQSETDLSRHFHEIVAQYDSMIMKICFGYARYRDELDDLHQDALINIWQGLERFRGDSSIKTWVYRITLNTCVSTVRRRREVAQSDLVELYSVIDDSEERRRMIAEMHDMISCLSPVDKAIVLMWLDEFDYEEIARIVGMPRNTVATRLRRAKDKLVNMK